jgi:hypothetical protein
MRRVLPSVRPIFCRCEGRRCIFSFGRMRAIVNPNERRGGEVGFGNAEAGGRMKHSLAFLEKAKNGRGMRCFWIAIGVIVVSSILGEDCLDGRLLFIGCWFKNDGLILGESLRALTKLDCDLLMTLGTPPLGPFTTVARPLLYAQGRWNHHLDASRVGYCIHPFLRVNRHRLGVSVSMLSTPPSWLALHSSRP